MSHVTTLRGVKIIDIPALQSAIAELAANGVNISLAQNAKPRMYYRHQEQVVDYVVKIPGSNYDIALTKQEDGSYAPAFDEWNGSVSRVLGASCPMPNTAEGRVQHQIGKLLQGYAKHAALNQAARDGYMVQSADVDAEGNVQIILAGM